MGREVYRLLRVQKNCEKGKRGIGAREKANESTQKARTGLKSKRFPLPSSGSGPLTAGSDVFIESFAATHTSVQQQTQARQLALVQPLCDFRRGKSLPVSPTTHGNKTMKPCMTLTMHCPCITLMKSNEKRARGLEL